MRVGLGRKQKIFHFSFVSFHGHFGSEINEDGDDNWKIFCFLASASLARDSVFRSFSPAKVNRLYPEPLAPAFTFRPFGAFGPCWIIFGLRA